MRTWFDRFKKIENPGGGFKSRVHWWSWFISGFVPSAILTAITKGGKYLIFHAFEILGPGRLGTFRLSVLTPKRVRLSANRVPVTQKRNRCRSQWPFKCLDCQQQHHMRDRETSSPLTKSFWQPALLTSPRPNKALLPIHSALEYWLIKRSLPNSSISE